MMEITLSIIVPIYNTSHYLDKCLNSLLNQSLKNIEIILINDGSTDASHHIIEKNFQKIPNIKYVQLKENKGLGNARNIGISMAQGEYLTFVDSDDWVDLDLYKVVIDKLKNSDAEIAIYGIINEFTNQKSSCIRYQYLFDNTINNEQALRLLAKSQNNNYFLSAVVWNKVYRTSVLKNNNLKFLIDSYWEDDIFSFEVLLQVEQVLIVPEVYYHYYNRPNSITNCISQKHIDDLTLSFNYLKKKLKKNGIWEKYQFEFNALTDKCICYLSELIFKNENNVAYQKKYIIYLLEQLIKNFSIKEIISYLDTYRIRKIFNHTI